MPAPEPPAAPNRPSDGPWPGPDPPGPEPPADIGSARDGGLRVVALVALDRRTRSCPGRRARRTPRARRRRSRRPRRRRRTSRRAARRRRRPSPAAPWWAPSRDRKAQSWCGRRLRCRRERRGCRLEGGRAGMRDGVAVAPLLAGVQPRTGPARVPAGGLRRRRRRLRGRRRLGRRRRFRNAARVSWHRTAASLGGSVPRRGSPRDRRVGLLCARRRASARTRARTRPAAPAAATAKTVVGLPTSGLGRTSDID